MSKLSDYSCLNFHNEEFTLINNPYIPDEFERYLEFRIESNCENYVPFSQLSLIHLKFQLFRLIILPTYK